MVRRPCSDDVVVDLFTAVGLSLVGTVVYCCPIFVHWINGTLVLAWAMCCILNLIYAYAWITADVDSSPWDRCRRSCCCLSRSDSCPENGPQSVPGSHGVSSYRSPSICRLPTGSVEK